MRREGACAKRRRLAPTRGQAHGRMPPAGAYGEAGGPRRGDAAKSDAAAVMRVRLYAYLCLYYLLPPFCCRLLHLHYCICVYSLRCRCIAVVLPLYCRCAVCRIYLLRLSCTRFALPSLRGREWGSTRRTLAEMPSMVRMRCLILRSTSSIWRTSSEKSCWLIST